MIFIIIVSLLTLIHEYGHYKVAKASGVRVMEFSIGFGPIAFQRVVKGTAYSFR
ncbi:MAG: hypothetical protein DRP42_03515 [Tenericutes bacterium]|nr:MAG: hypothetical protein DRP42_03515 [Mycoplasmatota bacterium]